jgi:hypothetical protein
LSPTPIRTRPAGTRKVRPTAPAIHTANAILLCTSLPIRWRRATKGCGGCLRSRLPNPARTSPSPRRGELSRPG